MSRQTVVKTVLVDTLEIGYEESGPANSNPVILLHGFPDDARAWDGVVGPQNSALHLAKQLRLRG